MLIPRVTKISADQMEFAKASRVRTKHQLPVFAGYMSKVVGVHNGAYPLFDVILIYISPRVVTLVSNDIFYPVIRRHIDIVIIETFQLQFLWDHSLYAITQELLCNV